MALRKFVMILPVAALVAGCQADKKTGREQELEQRVQTLERQLLEAQMASPSPQPLPSDAAAYQPAQPAASGTAAAAPPPAQARTAPVPVERPQTVWHPPATASRTSRNTSSASRRQAPAPSRTARRDEPRTESEDHEPFDGGRPSAEPMGRGDDDRMEQVETRTSMVLPEGTELQLVLEQPLSSATSHAGDTVTARVERAVSEDGRVILPGGTVLQGRVVEARSSGRVSGRARLAVDFDRIVVRGRTHELDASTIVAEAPGESGRDAKIVGGSAAAGAVLGAIANGRRGAVRGAIIGAGAGGAAVLVNKGREVEMPSGSRWTVRVRNQVRL
jgi:type IV secretory pathway VirB10-like protein